MIRPSILFVTLVLFFAGSERGVAADAAAGKAVAAGCAGCHGEDGIAQSPDTPSLAAQPDEFIQWQLVYFRSGTRKNEVMQPIAEALSNEEIRNLGAYYSALPPPKPQASGAADALAQEGEKIAKQFRCRTCHADKLEGKKVTARLAGQREDVLLKALRDFKSGLRIGVGVATMADVVYGLNDHDMQALARYMAALP